MNTATALTTIPAEQYDRRRYIGGSAIASILGLQPPKWKTAVQLWQRMTADEPERESPQAARRRMARGHIVEPLVAHLLADLHGVPEHAIRRVSNNRYVDSAIPYFAAEIDFELPYGAVAHLFDFNPAERYAPDDQPVNVEIKTVHPFAAKEWGDEGSDELPIHYAAQVQWGMGVTRRRLALCAALFGADDLKLYPMEIDEQTVTGMRLKAAAFMRNVRERVQPDPQTLGDAKLLWPTDDGSTVEATDEVVSAVRTLALMREKFNKLKGGMEGIDLLIREHIESATTLTLNGEELATLKAQSQRFIDEAKLKTEFPDAYAACLTKRHFRVLKLAKE